jgi:DedD protein
MDRKVQERLIGAVVLVVLGVWLIPWVLDGQQESTQEDSNEPVALELPTPNDTGPGREPPTQTIEIEVSKGQRRGAVTVDEADARARAGGNVDRDLGASGVSALQSTGTVSTETARVASVDRENVGAAAGASVRDAASTGWMIQLGSFSDDDNARRQADRIRTYGYDPVISDFVASGRSMYRVRVGPHDSRAAAEAAASALSAHGFVSQIIPPE